MIEAGPSHTAHTPNREYCDTHSLLCQLSYRSALLKSISVGKPFIPNELIVPMSEFAL
jgi:hypothetical protein